MMRQPVQRSFMRTCAFLALGFTALSLQSCQRALFPEKEPRTQFETYDLMRQRFIPLEEPDVFGEPKPALRARLGRN